MNTNAKIKTAIRSISDPSIPPVLSTGDLPGPLSLNRLAAFGTVRKLDESAGYCVNRANSLYGRAIIIGSLSPFGTVVCMQTAAWVWLGGEHFPDTIDVISTSQFRSTSVGRRIRVYKRLTLPEQVIKLGTLQITTPARTACDLVMAPEDATDPSDVNTLVMRLMTVYRFRPNDCLRIVREHRHHKYAARARTFFDAIQRELNDSPLNSPQDESSLSVSQTDASLHASQTDVQLRASQAHSSLRTSQTEPPSLPHKQERL
ncbi:hypothetical protein G1C95_2102 [Bifidobacterium sp. DSM 109957]|uniref:Uncharacterized protein n=1 Tax=Bifidobacterium oedipodis TaxID=2675322 RepID=A0A7Y0ERA7_9BIFI|nr:hypothetical protein [Bifidobacterium sp. DSM 109957]NMM94914.1 hypothetical protein [Bifidobacterium sp. DSM 109957]